MAPPRKLNAQRCMLDTFMQFPPIILNPSNKNEILRLQSTTVVSTYYVVTLVEPKVSDKISRHKADLYFLRRNDP